jgi:hypothetical protein
VVILAIERGAVKQWEMTSLLCAAHCLPANRPSRTGNRTGARVRSFDLANEARHDDKWQNSHGARWQKQLQTALILSVTFIVSFDLIGESASTAFDYVFIRNTYLVSSRYTSCFSDLFPNFISMVMMTSYNHETKLSAKAAIKRGQELQAITNCYSRHLKLYRLTN